jgi:CHAT domain-containing protein
VIAFVAKSDVSDIKIEVIRFPQRVYSDFEDLLGKSVSATSAIGFLVDAVAFSAQEIDGEKWSSVIQDVADRASALLFDHIMETLEELGLIRGAPVALLLGGAISVMPVAMMRGGRTCERFIDRFELRVAPSLSALAIARDRAVQIQSARRLAALVDTKGDLPFARLEGALVSSWFDDEKERSIIDNKVSKEAIMAILSESSYWHFACHGSFDWNQPEKAGLQLAHGKTLSVEDLFNNIGGRPRLVVLSACETGLQDMSFVPYEAFGLLGAMLHAGAAATIGTLWRVDDLSAALLSARFYESFIGGRQWPAAALREAQIWIRDTNCRSLIDYLTTQEMLGRIPAKLASPATSYLSKTFLKSQIPYADPLHWAGWIIMGI